MYTLGIPNIVETYKCNSSKEIDEYHEIFVKKGYEGIMIRNSEGKYIKDKRSFDLLKLKHFQTNEYRIKDIIQCKNDNDSSLFVFDQFTARPQGNLENRQNYFHNKENLINKYAIIRYQNLTAKGVPRFPVFIGIRDYE